jgi:hypothetical protein
MMLYPFQKELKRTEESLKNYILLSNGLCSTSHDVLLLINECIKFHNGYAISIQASGVHYCSPRLTLIDPTKYDAYEVVVYYSGEHSAKQPFDVEHTYCYLSVKDVQKLFDCVKAIKTPESRKYKIGLVVGR